MKVTDLFGRPLRVIAVGASGGFEDAVCVEDTTTGEQFRIDPFVTLAPPDGPAPGIVYLKVTPTA
jgi:hypothetical protein